MSSGFLSENLGEIAALMTASCWVGTSLAFAAAGRRVGPTIVNMSRIALASVVLAIVNRLQFGVWIPDHDSTGLILLAISGLLGLAIGDQLLFTALVDVGPRISTLLMTLAPPAAAILAWPLLDERLSWFAIAGMGLTVGGVAWVVIERPAGASATAHRHRRRGLIFGALAGLCQATGLVIAKIGMGHGRLPAEAHIAPWSATLVRMVVATVGLWTVAGIVRTMRRRRAAIAIDVSPETEHLPPVPRVRSSRKGAAGFIIIGTILGPVTGVWLSMVSVNHAKAGIAATLMATTPIMILPFAVLIEKERVTWRAVLGAVVAIAGVALLTLS